MRAKQIIQKTGSVIILTLLYAIFFAAQLFSVNQDYPGKRGTVVVFKIMQAAKLIVSSDDKSDKDQLSAENGVRLNKRFQPSEMILNFTGLTYFPSIPVIKKPIESYLSGFVTSFCYPSVLLRGPPPGIQC